MAAMTQSLGLSDAQSPYLPSLLGHFAAAVAQHRSDVPIRAWELRRAGMTADALLAHVPGPYMVRHHPEAAVYVFTRVRR